MSEGYRVQLDVFTGPLDLLLYLIRRDELDIQDIPIARLTEQYLAYVHVLEQIDPNAAGEFLVMASTLVELKSRALLPTPPLEPMDDDLADPRTTLVRQLLEYKRFKDAAQELRRAGDERAQRFPRSPADLPKELQGVELEEAQVWDLLEAFGRVMTAIGRGPSQHEVQYDDTPIELYQAEIVAVLAQETATFQALFDGRTSRSEIIGRFLAILELIRSGRVRAEQDRNFGTIYLFLMEPPEPEAELPVPDETLGIQPALADQAAESPTQRPQLVPTDTPDVAERAENAPGNEAPPATAAPPLESASADDLPQSPALESRETCSTEDQDEPGQSTPEGT
jgi:segregation and condensation protein A